MIKTRIQIENGAVEDSFAKWGFVYVSGTKMFAPPEKPRDKSSYIGEAGSHEDSRTVDDEFDYKVRFLVEAPNKNTTNVNKKIKAWNDAVREPAEIAGVKRCKTVTFYDDYMRCKITGIPEIIGEVDDDDFYRMHNGTVLDYAVVELTIHVSRPELCDFSTEY